MYITNDYGLHTGFGRFWEMLFAMRTAFVVHYDGKDSWDIAVDRICFGNGILAKQDTLYVATTRKDGLLAFARKSDGTVHKRTQIVDLKGMDNLTQTPGGAILTAAHSNFIAFKKHAGNPENLSPGIVYRIDPDARNAEPVYASDGEEISGNSTALYYKGHLYIGQVFEGYILQCSTPELQ